MELLMRRLRLIRKPNLSAAGFLKAIYELYLL